jgi:hypothetical protein
MASTASSTGRVAERRKNEKSGKQQEVKRGG